jgi:hypothetical protein
MKKTFAILLSSVALHSYSEVVDGSVDLAGESVSYASLEGSGTISNSSQTMSVITVDCSSDCVFEGKITGNINKEDFDENLIMQCATGNQTYGMGGDE